MTSPGLSEPNYKFSNEFKQQSEPRPAKQAKPRRDRQQVHQQIFFDNQRPASVPPPVLASNQAFASEKLGKKPAGDWRAPAVSNFQRNGSRPENRVFNEGEHLRARNVQSAKRSRSLNPLIYPEWWGQDETVDYEEPSYEQQ